jgi:regulator of sigma E protease
MKYRLITLPPTALAYAWLGGVESIERLITAMGGRAPGYLAFWLGLMMVVIIHEFGHWCVARFFGMKTPVFSIGWGPREYSWVLGTWKETEWRIGWIPFGGFVSIPELADESITFGEFEGLKVFPVWKRMIVAFAGPLANFISAGIVVFGIYTAYGQPLRELRPLVDELMPSPTIARDSGMMVNDRIMSIGGIKVITPQDFSLGLQSNKSKPIAVMIDRGGVRFPVFLTPDSEGRIGVSLTPVIERVYYKKPLGETLYLAWEKTKETILKSAEGIGMMFHIVQKPSFIKDSDLEVRGLIYMVQTGAEAYQSGAFNFFWNIVLLSVGLGILNLAPVPVLDGGNIVFYVIEGLRGKSISAKKRILMQQIGMVLLLCLMIYGFFNDIKHLVLNLIA